MPSTNDPQDRLQIGILRPVITRGKPDDGRTAPEMLNCHSKIIGSPNNTNANNDPPLSQTFTNEFFCNSACVYGFCNK